MESSPIFCIFCRAFKNAMISASAWLSPVNAISPMWLKNGNKLNTIVRLKTRTCCTYHYVCSTEESFLQDFLLFSEVKASGLLENREEMFLPYCDSMDHGQVTVQNLQPKSPRLWRINKHVN